MKKTNKFSIDSNYLLKKDELTVLKGGPINSVIWNALGHGFLEEIVPIIQIVTMLIFGAPPNVLGLIHIYV